MMDAIRFDRLSMDELAQNPDDMQSESARNRDRIVREFIEHWGMMARAWGINPTMGELFALLYITGADWTAEELRLELRVSRGNVSMNLRELLSWGVVRKLHRTGERRELYRAETEVWTLFRRILKERKRRELDPTLAVLERLQELSAQESRLHDLRERIDSLRQFFTLVETLAVRLLSLDQQEMAELKDLLLDQDHASSRSSSDSEGG